MRWLAGGMVLFGLALAGASYWPLGIALAVGLYLLWKTC